MKKSVVLYALLILCAPCLLAEGTRIWKQSSFDDFEKGTAKGVAVTSEGSLELAPALKAVYTTPSTYIWSIAADGEGNVFAAAGAPARVYRVTPDGKASVVFAPPELEVQALVVDTSGVLYAATSPDGKVYKIERAAKNAEKPAEAESDGKTDANFTSSVFFDPKTKYIWDLALDPKGQLYVATGDQGQIFRVDRKQRSSLFFKSDEAHIRVLAFDTKGNLIAGSDGSGLVYRISPTGDGFVLYSAPKKEITALAVDAAGNIYASGVGEKRVFQPLTSGQPQPQAQPSVAAGHAGIPQSSTGATGATASLNVNTTAPPPFPTTPGSEVYQIAPDGSPRRIWSSRDDIVYALGFDDQGHLLAGSGNKARIYSIESNGDYVDLLKTSATQVTAFSKGPNNGLYVATSNLGKIFLLGPQPDSEGTYESDVFDAHIFSRWGRLEVLGNGNYDLFARSGNVDNPDRNWSHWTKVDIPKGAIPDVPAARFIQWKAVLHPGATPARIDAVNVNYRPNNVAPVVEDVTVQVGVRYNVTSTPKSGEGSVISTGPRFEAPPPAIRDHESISARWTAHDDNDDELVFSLYYRGDNETQWKLLKDKITEKYVTWDAGLFPDGGYTIKVVASDAPSHSPDEALTGSKESTRFEVDNTPPLIENLNAALEAGQMHVTFRAADNFSPIKRAEYSLDAGDWHFVEPVGLLSDSRVENYDFSIPMPAEPAKPADDVKGKKHVKSELPPEHVVVVRVYDRFDNMVAAKTLARDGSKVSSLGH